MCERERKGQGEMRMNGKVAREHGIYFNFSHKYKFDLSLVKFHHFSSLHCHWTFMLPGEVGCRNRDRESHFFPSFFFFRDKEHLVLPHPTTPHTASLSSFFTLAELGQHIVAKPKRNEMETRERRRSKKRKILTQLSLLLVLVRTFFFLLLWKLTSRRTERAKHKEEKKKKAKRVFIHWKSLVVCLLALLYCCRAEGDDDDDEKRFPISVLNFRLLFVSGEAVLFPISLLDAMIYFCKSKKERMSKLNCVWDTEEEKSKEENSRVEHGILKSSRKCKGKIRFNFPIPQAARAAAQRHRQRHNSSSSGLPPKKNISLFLLCRPSSISHSIISPSTHSKSPFAPLRFYFNT